MKAAFANAAWVASQTRAYFEFRRQLAAPAETQTRLLQRLLARHASCAYGRENNFGAITHPKEFAARVPLTNYDQLEPWIQRIMRGESNVLTSDPVTHLIPTSGSSGARKLIPFTPLLQREFDAAIGPWIFDLFTRCPAAMAGPSYWSISPNVGEDNVTCAVPIGFEDDTKYLGGFRQHLVAATMAAPSALREIHDIETFSLLTAVSLLRCRSLRVISVWHPSFLTLLLETMRTRWDGILEIIHTGRLPRTISLAPDLIARLRLTGDRARSAELAVAGPHAVDRFWPYLAIISCWASARASHGATELSKLFPRVTIQAKGLLATEAFVSIPFGGRHPLAIGSHYFEFVDEAGEIHTIKQLQLHHCYEVVVTTGGGLWRYRLGDIVQVDGFVGATPSIRFLGKAGNVSDLFGEKITELFAAKIIERLSQESKSHPSFALMAPKNDSHTGRYTLFWAGEDTPSPVRLDELLAENPHYKWCRQIGQLREAAIFAVHGNPEQAYLNQYLKRGAKLGEIKIPALSQQEDWDEIFSGNYVNSTATDRH